MTNDDEKKRSHDHKPHRNSHHLPPYTLHSNSHISKKDWKKLWDVNLVKKYELRRNFLISNKTYNISSTVLAFELLALINCNLIPAAITFSLLSIPGSSAATPVITCSLGGG